VIRGWHAASPRLGSGAPMLVVSPLLLRLTREAKILVREKVLVGD
jgi:hypothetical protein